MTTGRSGPSEGGAPRRYVAGSLLIAIRVTAPPAGVQQQDVAHSQKRALEAALASAVTTRIIGANAPADFNAYCFDADSRRRRADRGRRRRACGRDHEHDESGAVVTKLLEWRLCKCSGAEWLSSLRASQRPNSSAV